MASRRGLNNEDRLALNIATVTADASLVEAPCYVYMIVASLIDTTTTGGVSIADSSASGDADKETEKLEFKLGTALTSAGAPNPPLVITPPKPIYFAKTCVADITNVQVGVAFLPAN